MAFRLPKRPNDLRFVSQIARTGEKKSKVRVGGENEAAGAAAAAVVAVE